MINLVDLHSISGSFACALIGIWSLRLPCTDWLSISARVSYMCARALDMRHGQIKPFNHPWHLAHAVFRIRWCSCLVWSSWCFCEGLCGASIVAVFWFCCLFVSLLVVSQPVLQSSICVTFWLMVLGVQLRLLC